MGYYINILQKNKMYELDGQKLLFVEKFMNRFYFKICKMGEWTFKYEPTDEEVSFSSDDMFYIKRFEQEPTKFSLRKVGKDKVFPRN